MRTHRWESCAAERCPPAPGGSLATLVEAWQFWSDAKPLLEVSKVVAVTVRPLVAEMKPKLECWAQALDRVAGDHSVSFQIIGRVAAPGRTVVRELLPTVLGVVKDEWMEVDLTAP